MAKEVKSLEAHAIIGFDGSAIKGLKVHPDGEHIIYPMGNKVCIQHWKTKQMHFLSGHSNSVSTVAVSFDGKYIGSGQINHIGFKALVILWDFQKKIKIGSHELHKVRVEALTFSSDARFLISLGGRDDGALVLWNCEAGAATATAPAARLTTGDATCAASLNKRPNAFVTGGDSNLRVWSMRPGSSSLEVVDVALGKLRRCVRSLAIADDDSIGYAGTTSGDIIKFSINYPADPSVPVDTCKPALIGCLAKCGRQKKNQKPEAVCYSQGVESILLMSDGCLVVGGGDGSVDALREGGCRAPPKTRLCQPTAPSYKALRSVKLPGSITSLELMESAQMQGDNRILLAGTRTSEIYAINVKTFEAILVVTCHRCAINDIAFPKGMSGVFATAGAGSARVWSAASAQELLRIEVPNFVCSAVLFTADGKSLVTAWNDGCIRAFTPLTGRLMYCILNTHNKGASALDMTTDGTTLVSGGCEGQVRVWDIKPQCQTLKKVLKEHKSPVSAIQVSPNNCEAVSAGTDGSCIIWDLISLSRRRVLYANTLFSCARYEPGGCQLLTAGSDRRVACWETATGTLARELEASKVGAVNGLDISYNGELFATGANDQMVKLWKYQEGIYTHTGLGHAGAVTCLRFSPDMRYIVSCCAAGSIVIWKMPAEYIPKTPPPTPASEISLKLPSAPSKDEKIEKMNTSRSSVHACCPCEPPKPPSWASVQSSGDSAKSGGSRGSKGSGVKDNLPKKTPSKESVNSGGGDKRK